MSGRFYGFDFPPEVIGGDSIDDCAKECNRLENDQYRCKIMKLLLRKECNELDTDALRCRLFQFGFDVTWCKHTESCSSESPSGRSSSKSSKKRVPLCSLTFSNSTIKDYDEDDKNLMARRRACIKGRYFEGLYFATSTAYRRDK